MYIKIIEDLVIYQIAMQLADETNGLIKQVPNYWGIVECKQILRSSSSCPSNIQECFAQRFYVKKLISYLNNAIGSSDESKGHFEKLRNNGHIKSEIANSYISRYKNLSVRILRFINYLKKRHNIKLN